MKKNCDKIVDRDSFFPKINKLCDIFANAKSWGTVGSK